MGLLTAAASGRCGKGGGCRAPALGSLFFGAPRDMRGDIHGERVKLVIHFNAVIE